MTRTSPARACVSGCTDECPGGAAEHADVLRRPVLRRLESEWEDWQVEVGIWRHRSGAPMPHVAEPRGLPRGWRLVRTYRDILGEREHVHLIRCPRGPGKTTAWVLLSQWTSPDGVALVPSRQLWDTTLARLAVELDNCMPDHTWKDDPWRGVRDRLWETVAEFYDLTDPDEAAEATLHALSGRFRSFPRAALTR